MPTLTRTALAARPGGATTTNPNGTTAQMAPTYESDLARKLNLRSGMTVHVVACPRGVELGGLSVSSGEASNALLAFVTKAADVDTVAAMVVAAAQAGKVTWMAYPKAKQLGTDLNRDILWRQMQGRGLDAVRQVAIDGTWSAIRFKIH